MTYQDFGGFALPRLTPAVKALLIANFAVFLANALLTNALTPWLALSWTGMWEGYGLGLLRLLTYQFVHSFVDPLHILLNMLVLYFFGTFVEEAVGPRRLTRLYLVSGVVGGLTFCAIGAMLGQPDRAVVGASGAVYGILIYAACMAPRMRVILIVFPIELRWLALGLVGIGAYMMFIEVTAGYTGGVAHGGHLGGALWGYLAYRMPRQRRWPILERFEQWRLQRAHQQQVERQATLDRLLEKVHREGIGSLTAAERRALDRASQEMRRR